MKYLEKGVNTLLTNRCQITMPLRDHFVNSKNNGRNQE